MSNSNILEIIQGLHQAAANAYDGAHDERYVRDGEQKMAGLRREEGCPIHDKRVNDGFKVNFHGDSFCILYQSDIQLKEVHAGGFENNINAQINEIKNFLQKEYKSITGKSITLTPSGEVDIMVQSTSRVRSFVTAKQYYDISQFNLEPSMPADYDSSKEAIKKFLSQARSGRAPNDERRG